MTSPDRIRPIGRLAFLALPLAAALAGCQGTLHNRWATRSDTPDYWGTPLADMPVEVHGAIPGLDHVQTVQRIPAGTSADIYAGGHPTAPGLGSLPRLVLYLGGSALPTDASYCSAAPAMRPAEAGHGGVMVAAALCDGPRLVVRARRNVAVDRLDAGHVADTLHGIRKELLFGLGMSPAQTPTCNPNS